MATKPTSRHDRIARNCQMAELNGDRSVIYVDVNEEQQCSILQDGYSPVGPEFRERMVKRDLWGYRAPVKPSSIARRGEAKACDIIYRRAVKVMQRKLRDSGLQLFHYKTDSQTIRPVPGKELVTIDTYFAVWIEPA